MSMKYLPLLDYDKLFANAETQNIVPCDVSSLSTKDQVKDFMSYIFSDGNTEIDFGAACSCGSQPMYLLDMICPKCGDTIKRSSSLELTYSNWLQIPDFLPPLLQPAAYKILFTWMGKAPNKKSLLLSLMEPDAELPEYLNWYEPGMQSFHENFFKLVTCMLKHDHRLTIYAKRGGKRVNNPRSNDIPRFISKYRDVLFARYFPIMDSSMHVLTSDGNVSYMDESAKFIRKTINELANIHYVYKGDRNKKKVEALGVSLLQSYVGYSSSVMEKLKRKKGVIRSHLLGSRCHFTYRAVISPIIDAAYGDEVYLPWAIGIQQNKLEVMNLLVNRYKYDPYSAQVKYDKAIDTFDEEIYEILNTLIAECPYKGLPTLLDRTPSMIHGAIQLFFATRIKKDVKDHTISVSPLTIFAPNADFDGDAELGTMIKEMQEVEAMMNLHPMTTMLTANTLGIADKVNIGKQAALLANTWLTEGVDPDEAVFEICA